MKLWHKIGITGAVLGVSLGGVVATETVSTQISINSLPSSLVLKVPANKVLSVSLKNDTQYTYDDQGNIISSTTSTYEDYLYPSQSMDASPNEIVSRRTSDSRSYQIGNQIEIAFDAVEPYYQDTQGKWWYTQEATTTPAAFQLQTQASPLSSLFGEKVFAQTTSFLTTGAGTGPQTWNVPTDWNNSNNQVACIGSGSFANSGGGVGGGGGAYASTSNIVLTPGGTALYSIGASASSTSVVPTVTPARVTYFNGVSSSTASVECDWGTFFGTGGTVAHSIGTTKFAGGNGANPSSGGGGGGGAAGKNGAGKNAAAGVGSVGGGGGGANNGSVGSGQTGGNGVGGTGGGAANTNGTAGTGGGGGGGNASTAGGSGAIDTSLDSSHGSGGGGGGGGSGSAAGVGGIGGTYGGGAGAGGIGSGTNSSGGQGLIVLTYTPTAITFKQGTTCSGSVSPTNSTNFAGTVVAGDLIVVTTGDDSGTEGVLTSVGDSGGNTYTKIADTGSSNTGTETMWYTVVVTGGSSFHVILNATGGFARLSCAAQEFQGFIGTPTFDKVSAYATGSSVSPLSASSGTLSNSNELVVGGFTHYTTVSAFSAGTGYGNLSTVNVANAAVAQESNVVSATTAVTAGATIAASREWNAYVATFYDNTSGGGGTPESYILEFQ